MGDWEDNNFPLAEPPGQVRWMLVSWYIVKVPDCDHCTRGNYGLTSRQFDHFVVGATKAQVIQKMKDYINQHKDRGTRADRKGHVLFLTKVVAIKKISNLSGDIIATDDTVIEL